VQGSLRLIIIAGGIATALLLLAASPEPSIACVPVVAAAWLLAARGAADIAQDATGMRRFAAVAALAVLIPALQASHAWLLPPRVRSISLGQHEWSMRSALRLWVLLPRRASLVQEDSGFDLLTRALPAQLRERKAIAIVPRTPAAVKSALDSGAVFMLPLAQHELQRRGVTWEPGTTDWPVRPSEEVLTTIARVTAVRECPRVGQSWADVTSQLQEATVVLAAEDAASRGPVIMYLVGEQGLPPSPYEWPPVATRGFQALAFDRTSPAGAEALAARLAADRVADPRFTVASHVIRLELWRTPDAPLTLPVLLNERAIVALVRLHQEAPPSAALMLCASMETPPLRPRR
jgi:hypothetical protein